jgi:hypothetical protein
MIFFFHFPFFQREKSPNFKKNIWTNVFSHFFIQILAFYTASKKEYFVTNSLFVFEKIPPKQKLKKIKIAYNV